MHLSVDKFYSTPAGAACSYMNTVPQQLRHIKWGESKETGRSPLEDLQSPGYGLEVIY